ncbi:MAG: hypothetical protein WD022_03655 [Balneolaceae bacterium]
MALLNINDIWGSENPRTGEWEVLAVASNPLSHDGRELLKIEDNKVVKLSNIGLSMDLNTLWFASGHKYIIGGDGIFQAPLTAAEIWQRDPSFPSYYKTAVRGEALNDITIAGAFGLLMHFNGKDWQFYAHLLSQSIGLGSVAIKNEIIVAGGAKDNKGLILIGRRE